MLFSSIPFLYYFLPLVLVCYFCVPFRWKNFILLFFSLIFYSWGEPRYIFLSEDYYKNIFSTELAYKNALDIENYLKKYINPEIYESANEKDKNAFIFEYCLNICEMKGITYKADKMFVISEMSRSIFWGCISTIILNMYLIFVCSYCITFLYYEIPLLVISAIIFFYRKKRYEQYRIRILIRMFLIYVQQQTSKKVKSVE